MSNTKLKLVSKPRRITVLDADSIVYGSCMMLEDDAPVEYALGSVKRAMQKAIESTSCDELWPVVSGDTNFRYDVYPEYKANRKGERPKYIRECRDYIVKHWDGIQIEGIEADDTCAMLMYTLRGDKDVMGIISHIDKDLNMIEGCHYNYHKDEWYVVEEEEAYRNFHLQMLTGDTADNIPGLFKITGKMATKKVKDGLYELADPKDMWQYVHGVYKERVEDSAWPEVQATLSTISKLLWLKRADNEELEWQL
jgi:hypothetical protein